MNNETLVGQINLSKYLDSKIIEVNGDRGVFIPFSANPSIFEGAAGVYASVCVKPTPNDRYGNSHFIAASVRADILRAFSEADRRRVTPFIGNLRPLPVSKISAPDTEGAMGSLGGRHGHSWDSPEPSFSASAAQQPLDDDNDLPL